MNSRIRVCMTALALVLGLSLGLTHGAAAQGASRPTFAPTAAAPLARTGASGAPNFGLPTIKTPTSARFDMHGTVSSGGQTITISGSGMEAGQSAQVDVTVTVPGAPAAQTIHVITTNMKLYLRVNDDPQWQVEDLSRLGGSAGMLPGMGGMPGMSGMPGMMPGMIPGMGGNLADLMRLLGESIQVKQIGKDPINGAATTKYAVNIDLAKLAGGLGGPPLDAKTQQALAASSFMMNLWVGDADQYLYQLQLLLNIQAPGAQNQPQNVNLDFTVTFHDFGAPITITAPANAVPINLGGLPGGLAGGVPPIMTPPVVGPSPGMPRTGAPAGNPWPLGLVLGLALLCLGMGLRLRRRAIVVRSES